MLQLIVLWHKLGEDLSEFLDLRSQAKLLDQAICVLFQLFRFDLLIGVDEINALIQVLNLLTSLLVLAGLVLSQVVEKDLSRELRERCGKDVRFELEELINDIFVLDRVEDVSGKGNDILEGLVEVVALKAQLKLTDILTGDALIVEGKELGADGHWVNVIKTHREEHLAVSVKLLKHIRVAVFEDKEELLDTLKDKFLRLRRVDPFSQMIEEVLFENLAVFFTPKLSMNRVHASFVPAVQGLLHGAAI